MIKKNKNKEVRGGNKQKKEKEIQRYRGAEKRAKKREILRKRKRAVKKVR